MMITTKIKTLQITKISFCVTISSKFPIYETWNPQLKRLRWFPRLFNNTSSMNAANVTTILKSVSSALTLNPHNKLSKDMTSKVFLSVHSVSIKDIRSAFRSILRLIT
mgnify:CR=1 FL=1